MRVRNVCVKAMTGYKMLNSNTGPHTDASASVSKFVNENNGGQMSPLTVVLLVVAALIFAFGFIMNFYWLFLGAIVVVILGVIGGVASSSG